MSVPGTQLSMRISTQKVPKSRFQASISIECFQQTCELSGRAQFVRLFRSSGSPPASAPHVQSRLVLDVDKTGHLGRNACREWSSKLRTKYVRVSVRFGSDLRSSSAEVIQSLHSTCRLRFAGASRLPISCIWKNQGPRG